MTDGYEGPPRPLRTFETSSSESERYHLALFKLAYADYKGDLQVGWIKPWYRLHPKSGNVVKRVGWRPAFICGYLARPIEGSRFTEVHSAETIYLRNHEQSQLVMEQLERTLSAAYLALNRNHIYRLDAPLIDCLREYLAWYFRHPDTLKLIEEFRNLE